MQLFGTAFSNLSGWSAVNNVPRGTLVSIQTDVVFNYYGKNTPLYSKVADHIEYVLPSNGNFCLVM